MTMKRCKSCGQSLSNEDMISELPEALLLKILSLRPTKEVVAMSVLAKRWRSLWKMVPRLEFDDRMFSNNVSRCLLSHQAPVLQSLHLERNSDYESNLDIAILMEIAFGLHVRELVVYVYNMNQFRFPTSLYNFESLETLILGCSILVDVPSPVCLKSLRTLHLHEVDYKDDELVFNLLPGCISLENLVVHRVFQADVKTFVIKVPSLQRQTLTAENDDEDSVNVINVPSLNYLEFERVLDDGTCLIENTPELVEAKLRDRPCTDHGHYIFENILRTQAGGSVGVQEEQMCMIKFPTSSIFFLEYLEVYTYEPEWWNVLTLMLDSSPNLQVLKLNGSHKQFSREDLVACMKWNQPKYVPECLLLHLETLAWIDYEGELEDEKEVAKYILKNAGRLKKAKFAKKYIHPTKRLERLKELESVVMTSNSCQLVFKEV